MASVQVNTFASFDLDPTEELQGRIFTITQKQVLQNHLAACAEEKLSLEFNVSAPQEFIQQEAYKRGQIELLRYLLDASDSANAQLNTPTSLDSDT